MKIAILGYGKMGKEVEDVGMLRNNIAGKEIYEFVLKVDSKNTKDITPESLKGVDIAIEFTQPESAHNNILKCFAADIPVVTGTTGWIQKLPEIKEICEKEDKTLFYTPNFSIGVNIFFELNERLARIMNHRSKYDISIEEIHHDQKKDKPSGTAIFLANQIIAHNHFKKKWTIDEPKTSSDLRITSVREGQIAGIHTVAYESNYDTLMIKHVAHSRKAFAEGALLAAEFVIGKKGFFEMKDLLYFNS